MQSRRKSRAQIDFSLPKLVSGLFPWIRITLPPPMLAPALAALVGSFFAWRWPSFWILSLGLMIWLLFNHWIIRWPNRSTLLVLSLVFLICGFRHVGLIRNGQQAQRVYSGQIETVEAVVREVKAGPDGSWGRARIELANGCLTLLVGPVAHLLPSQQIRTTARFSTPSPVRNPGGFDETRYLAGNGVFLKAEVLLGRITILNARSNPIETPLIHLRNSLGLLIRRGLPDREAALLMGVLIGDTSGMGNDDLEAFQTSGLSHLTAVSGANVAFVLIPVVAVLRKLIRKRRHRNSLSILFLVAFGFLTGWEPSVTRAILMMTVVMAGRLVNRRSDPVNALLFAIIAMLLIHPEQVIAQSFQLSFLATGGILLFREPIEAWLDDHTSWIPGLIQQLLSVNLAVQIAVLPVQISLSHQLSPFTVLANLLAMPLAEGATLLGALGLGISTLLSWMESIFPALINPAAWLMQGVFRPAGYLLAALYDLAELFSATFWPRLPVGSWPALALAAYGLAVGSCLIQGMRRQQLRKLAAVLAFSCLLLSVHRVWSFPEAEIIILDVGQGDATIVRVKEGPVILIDAGTEKAGRQIIRPALLALGISRVDLGIVTHGHQDHAGGFLPLIESGLVRSLAVPMPALQLAQLEPSSVSLRGASDGLETDLMTQILDLASRQSIPVQALQKDDTMRINQTVTISILAPKTANDAEIRRQSRSRGANAFSLILRLSIRDWVMLMMADCDQETEQNLVEEADLACDLLRVAHHGSASTTRGPLLDRMTPDLALISVGQNDYGHPAPVLLDRLEKKLFPVLRTDQRGAITLRVENGRCRVRTMIP